MAYDDGSDSSDNSSDNSSDSGSDFGGSGDTYGGGYSDVSSRNARQGYGSGVNAGFGLGRTSESRGPQTTQGQLRQMEQDYLNSQQGSQSFYDAMLGANKGNISDMALSRYMDSLGIDYGNRSNLLGGIDALSTGRGGWGDFLSSAVNTLGNFVPGYNLLSTGLDIGQRLMHGGTVGGNLIGNLVGGVTGNPIASQLATYGTNLLNGDTVQNQLQYALKRNTPALLSAAGVSPQMQMGVNLANTGANLLQSAGVSFGSNSSRGLF